MRRALAVLLAALLATPAAAGTVRVGLEAPSPALGRPLTYSLYLPEGGAAGRPVLYLLHGHGADHREWLDLGRIEATLDRLIAAGEIRPVVAVMPDAAESWYVDSAERGGPGDYATAIADDLSAHIERAYGADEAARAVAGLSMGGFGALVLGFTRPERYTTVAALSPAVFRPGGVSWAHWSLGATAAERERWFAEVFGDPFSFAIYRRAQPFALVGDLDAAAAPRLWLAAGDDDGFGFELGTVEMFLALRARGIPVELRIADGGHDWTYWRSVVADLLRFIDAGWPSRRNRPPQPRRPTQRARARKWRRERPP